MHMTKDIYRKSTFLYISDEIYIEKAKIYRYKQHHK